MSAVVEYADGRMETLLYKDFMKRLAYGECCGSGTLEKTRSRKPPHVSRQMGQSDQVRHFVTILV